MKYARNSYICGEDLSHLNFGNIPLNNIFFSINGEHPTSFKHSNLNYENFIYGHTGEDIVRAEFSSDSKKLITWGDDGKIIVWDFQFSHVPCQSYQFNKCFDKSLVYSLPSQISIELTQRKCLGVIKDNIYSKFIPASIKSDIESNEYLYEVYTVNDSSRFAIFRYHTKNRPVRKP